MPMKVLAAAIVALAFAAPAAAQPKLTPAERAAITRSIDVFVNHAVKRSNPAAAFDVVAPEMRPAMTRKSWKGGDIPVYPFPAAGTGEVRVASPSRAWFSDHSRQAWRAA